MWNKIKKTWKWIKYRLRNGIWWNVKEKVRKVYHESKGEKSYMIEVYGGKAIYENRTNMENELNAIHEEKTIEYVPDPRKQVKHDLLAKVYANVIGKFDPIKNQGKDI